MSKKWMPLFVGDYLRDTQKLTAAEHGAYLMLIMEYWQSGELPTDDKRLAMIARMTPSEWKRARPVIAAFFTPEWRHKRIDAELAHADDVIAKRQAAAAEMHRKHSKKPAKGHANGPAGGGQSGVQSGVQSGCTDDANAPANADANAPANKADTRASQPPRKGEAGHKAKASPSSVVVEKPTKVELLAARADAGFCPGGKPAPPAPGEPEKRSTVAPRPPPQPLPVVPRPSKLDLEIETLEWGRKSGQLTAAAFEQACEEARQRAVEETPRVAACH